jgi:hypothetical protein
VLALHQPAVQEEVGIPVLSSLHQALIHLLHAPGRGDAAKGTAVGASRLRDGFQPIDQLRAPQEGSCSRNASTDRRESFIQGSAHAWRERNLMILFVGRKLWGSAASAHRPPVVNAVGARAVAGGEPTVPFLVCGCGEYGAAFSNSADGSRDFGVQAGASRQAIAE